MKIAAHRIPKKTNKAIKKTTAKLSNLFCFQLSNLADKLGIDFETGFFPFFPARRP